MPDLEELKEATKTAVMKKPADERQAYIATRLERLNAAHEDVSARASDESGYTKKQRNAYAAVLEEYEAEMGILQELREG